MITTTVQEIPQVTPTTERKQFQRKMLPHPIIRLLVEDNPKRLGSSAYTRFTHYEDGITVEEYFKRGGRPEDLKWDEEHHYIKLERYRYVPTAVAVGVESRQ